MMLRAMDTEVTVVTPTLAGADAHAARAAVAAVFADAEARFSRFRSDSELARLNRATAPTQVSRPLMAALLRAREHVALTSGRFDPTVGGALIAAGYDRPFRDGLDEEHEPAATPRVRFAELGLDASRRVIDRPAHLQLDLGGMIKGATVDQAARLLPPVAALEAGGDAVLRGEGPDGAGWYVDVEDPADPVRTVATLIVRDRAVATSAANRRRWRRGTRWSHHLIDPATARPAVSDLAQVTVVDDTAERAEVLAKAVYIAGSRAGRGLLDRVPTAGAVLVDRDGRVELVGAVEVAGDA